MSSHGMVSTAAAATSTYMVSIPVLVRFSLKPFKSLFMGIVPIPEVAG